MLHQGYDSEDSIDTWTLTPEDHALVAGKSRVNRRGFAVLLLFFRANGRFPEASENHAARAYEDRFCETIRDRMMPVTHARLEALLQPVGSEIEAEGMVELSSSARAV